MAEFDVGITDHFSAEFAPILADHPVFALPVFQAVLRVDVAVHAAREVGPELLAGPRGVRRAAVGLDAGVGSEIGEDGAVPGHAAGGAVQEVDQAGLGIGLGAGDDVGDKGGLKALHRIKPAYEGIAFLEVDVEAHDVARVHGDVGIPPEAVCGGVFAFPHVCEDVAGAVDVGVVGQAEAVRDQRHELDGAVGLAEPRAGFTAGGEAVVVILREGVVVAGGQDRDAVAGIEDLGAGGGGEGGLSRRGECGSVHACNERARVK